MNRSHKIDGSVVLCVTNAFIVVISGWAMKTVDKAAILCRGSFPALMACGIFGILTFSRPDGTFLNPSLWNLVILLQLHIIPILVIKDAYYILNIPPGLIFYGAVICAIIAVIAEWKIIKFCGITSGISVICSSSLLIYLCYSVNEGYWILGFVVLCLFNQLVLSRLIRRYEISFLEFRNVAVCFYEIFALNAVNEIVSL